MTNSNKQMFFRTREVAEILNINATSVRRYCKAGMFPCIKIGSQYLVSKRFIDKILREMEHDIQEKNLLVL